MAISCLIVCCNESVVYSVPQPGCCCRQRNCRFSRVPEYDGKEDPKHGFRGGDKGSVSRLRQRELRPHNERRTAIRNDQHQRSADRRGDRGVDQRCRSWSGRTNQLRRSGLSSLDGYTTTSNLIETLLCLITQINLTYCHTPLLKSSNLLSPRALFRSVLRQLSLMMSRTSWSSLLNGT